MNDKAKKTLILLGLSVAIAVVLLAGRMRRGSDYTELEGQVQIGAGVPVLLELGSHSCVPCKMMMPILIELKTEYAGRFKVVFIDVWEDPDKAKEYGIKIIPTQIFYDASGKELFRHEGFFSKTDILTKWKELGIDIGQKQE